MQELHCLAIVATRKSTKENPVLGKKRMTECLKPMSRINPYTYQCPLGHQRHWPPDVWESKADR